VKDFKVVMAGYGLLKRFKGLVLKLNNLPAIEADQVIMMASFRSGLIPGFSVCKFPLGGQTEAGEEFQGAVNGRMAYFGIGFDDLGKNLSETFMPGGVQEDVENLFPLFGRLQPFFRDPCLKEVGFYESS